MDTVRIGLQIRALRRQRRWTQRELASRVGLSGSQMSRIERGAADRVSIRQLDRILAELGARLLARVLWRGEELDRLLDRDHAQMVERILELLARDGWLATPEVTFQVAGEHGSIDVLAWHAPTRTLLVIEVKSVVPDIQATLASLDRKARLGPMVARERGWVSDSVSRLLVGSRRSDVSAKDRSPRVDVRSRAPGSNYGYKAVAGSP
jgi:transcriptional regulator with XRE-family HTH domain